MNKITKYIGLAAAGTIALASCDLNLTPTTSIVYQEGEPIFTMQSDVDQFENNILANYRAIQMGEYAVAEEVMCDGFNAAMGYGNNYGGIHRTDADFTPGDYYVEDFWSGHYGIIKNFNIIIASADNCKPELKAAARIVKGEAFYMRANSYMQLARHFAPAYNAATASTELCVPLVLVYDQNEKPARATMADVYASIKSDLDSAAVILAKVAGAPRAQKPTIDAVNALYARYYLDVKDYANAAAKAAAVIGDGSKYALASSAQALWEVYSKDNGTEPIMQMYASVKEAPTSMGDLCGLSADTNSPSGFVRQPYFIPSGKLMDLYEDDDYRLAAWFDDGEETPIKLNNVYHSGEFYAFAKYDGNPEYNSSGFANGRSAIKPLLISEMYLIAAEGYANSNNNAKALEYLNALQAQRGATLTLANMDNIKKEWFKETVGQGLRMSCLKRWGDGFTARYAQEGAAQNYAITTGNDYATKALQANDYHFNWPIPSYDIKINKNLEQNTGYSAVK